MNEQELRALVRQAIARHGGMVQGHPPTHHVPILRKHMSHATFVLPGGADSGGPCLIEPSVPCTHCGYCKSYGH